MPTAYPAVGACFWFARSEDSNSCEGDRRLRRKQGAGAGAAVAEVASRPKGRRPMREPQPVKCPPSAPAGKKAPAQLCGGLPARSGHCAGLHHFFGALYQCAGGRCGERRHHGGVVVCRHPGVQPPGAGRGSQGLRQDRQGDHGAVRVLLFVDFLWYNCVTRRWLVCLQSFPSVI